jgi:hypothetical protein
MYERQVRFTNLNIGQTAALCDAVRYLLLLRNGEQTKQPTA